MTAALEDPEASTADRGDFDDTVSEGGASSIISNLSAYTQASGAPPASAVASNGRPPSTVGGRWPQKKKQQVCGLLLQQCFYFSCKGSVIEVRS